MKKVFLAIGYLISYLMEEILKLDIMLLFLRLSWQIERKTIFLHRKRN